MPDTDKRWQLLPANATERLKELEDKVVELQTLVDYEKNKEPSPSAIPYFRQPQTKVFQADWKFNQWDVADLGIASKSMAWKEIVNQIVYEAAKDPTICKIEVLRNNPNHMYGEIIYRGRLEVVIP